MKTISHGQLRDGIDSVIHEVQQGETVRITVAGRPVADLVPIRKVRRTFVPRSEVDKLLAGESLDRNFARSLDSVVGDTINELDRWS